MSPALYPTVSAPRGNSGEGTEMAAEHGFDDEGKGMAAEVMKIVSDTYCSHIETKNVHCFVMPTGVKWLKIYQFQQSDNIK